MLTAVILSILSYWTLQLALQPKHQRYVRFGPLVLETNLFNFLAPMADRDRTVSQRSEPNSRTTLIGEQPNPWDLLQPQDVMSRHRGAKPCRRYELSGMISLLSPAYLLSVEWWLFHTKITRSLQPTFVSDRHVRLSVRQAYAVTLHKWFPTILSLPSRASVTF